MFFFFSPFFSSAIHAFSFCQRSYSTLLSRPEVRWRYPMLSQPDFSPIVQASSFPQPCFPFLVILQCGHLLISLFQKGNPFHSLSRSPSRLYVFLSTPASWTARFLPVTVCSPPECSFFPLGDFRSQDPGDCRDWSAGRPWCPSASHLCFMPIPGSFSFWVSLELNS